MSFSDACEVGERSLFIADGGKIGVAADTKFNHNVHLNASVGGNISIGEKCLIGPNVVIRTASHRFDDLTRPIREQGHDVGDVVLGDNVWLAANVVVLPGITIGDGAVIAAGAVVTRYVPENAVVGGIPAQILRYRGERGEAEA